MIFDDDGKPIRLESYDAGYRDGWHDIHITRHPRRRRRRLKSEEYALGYAHGRTDGDEHPAFPDWWPDYARGAASDARFRALGPQPATGEGK